MKLRTGAKRKVHSLRDLLKRNGVRAYSGKVWCRSWELKNHEFALKRGFVPEREWLMEDERVLRNTSKWKGFQTTKRKTESAKLFCKNESVLRTEKG